MAMMWDGQAMADLMKVAIQAKDPEELGQYKSAVEEFTKEHGTKTIVDRWCTERLSLDRFRELNREKFMKSGIVKLVQDYRTAVTEATVMWFLDNMDTLVGKNIDAATIVADALREMSLEAKEVIRNVREEERTTNTDYRDNSSAGAEQEKDEGYSFQQTGFR